MTERPAAYLTEHFFQAVHDIMDSGRSTTTLSSDRTPGDALEEVPTILDPDLVFAELKNIQDRRFEATTRFVKNYGMIISSTGLYTRLYTLPTNKQLASKRYVLSIGHYPGSHDKSPDGLSMHTGKRFVDAINTKNIIIFDQAAVSGNIGNGNRGAGNVNNAKQDLCIKLDFEAYGSESVASLNLELLSAVIIGQAKFHIH
jgi:hypothetical protein